MNRYKKLDDSIIRQYIQQQKCWICGKDGWKALSQHLYKKHGLWAAEVRDMAYMFKKERLISEELSESLSKVALVKFGKRRHIPLRGEWMAGKVLSAKAKDVLKKRMAVIRPLAGIAQGKRKKGHYCPQCGGPAKTSRPEYCSPECAGAAISKSTKEHMTPERIARFMTIRQIPTSEQQSARSKRNWEIIRSWPIEKQAAYFAKGAEKRKSPLVDVFCVECGKKFSVPEYRRETKTCSRECLKYLLSKIIGERPVKDSTRLKLSDLAKSRHINQPLFGRRLE